MLYSALMEALGYSRNTHAFLGLAYTVPYQLLKEAVLESPADERVATIQRLLLNASGLLPPPQPSAERIYARRPKDPTRPKRQAGWHLFRVRPQNHPRLRIMAFAYVLEPFLPSAEKHEGGIPAWTRRGLLEGMTGLVRGCSKSARARDRWSSLERELMGTYLSLPWGSGDGERQEGRTPIGRGRARDMAVNCVLPLLNSYARLKGDAALEAHIFRPVPPLPAAAGERDHAGDEAAAFPPRGIAGCRPSSEAARRKPAPRGRVQCPKAARAPAPSPADNLPRKIPRDECLVRMTGSMSGMIGYLVRVTQRML